MFFGVFLFIWRRQEIIFGIIVYHGLCEYLIVVKSLGRYEMFIHESSHLIHIEVYVWNVLRCDKIYILHTANKIKYFCGCIFLFSRIMLLVSVLFTDFAWCTVSMFYFILNFALLYIIWHIIASKWK